MNEKHTFTAQARTVKGKQVKKLRTAGQVPANIIEPDHDSVMITVGQTDFKRLYHKVGDTGLIYLSIEGSSDKERPVLVEEVVFHPITGLAEHIVFRQVNLKEKTSAEIPVEVVGESPVKDSVVLTVVSEITVEALPTDLPEKFVVDVSTLTEFGQTITYADLDYDRSKVTLELGEQDETSPVIILQQQQEEVVEEPVAEEAAEGAEGAAPAEGEAPAAEEPKAEES